MTDSGTSTAPTALPAVDLHSHNPTLIDNYVVYEFAMRALAMMVMQGAQQCFNVIPSQTNVETCTDLVHDMMEGVISMVDMGVLVTKLRGADDWTQQHSKRTVKLAVTLAYIELITQVVEGSGRAFTVLQSHFANAMTATAQTAASDGARYEGCNRDAFMACIHGMHSGRCMKHVKPLLLPCL